jgi:PadR family transcriptional regulator, regulatory protein PadR
MSYTLTEYEQELLNGWEEIYKRGQLTLWILLALQDGPKHMAAIKNYIHAQTTNVVTADDQSMYRALRRYNQADMVSFTNEQVAHAPDRKIFTLTATGQHVLARFIARNIKSLINQPGIKEKKNEKRS